jgi:hypothetical protein
VNSSSFLMQLYNKVVFSTKNTWEWKVYLSKSEIYASKSINDIKAFYKNWSLNSSDFWRRAFGIRAWIWRFLSIIRYVFEENLDKNKKQKHLNFYHFVLLINHKWRTKSENLKDNKFFKNSKFGENFLKQFFLINEN